MPKEKDGTPKKFVNPGPGDGIGERLQAMVDNPPVRVQISVNGQVRRQLSEVPKSRVAISKKIRSTLTSAEIPAVGKPSVKITKSFDHELLAVEYRCGGEVVEFVPPTGSRGARRVKAMEESAFKRWAFPIMTGVGKGGWALMVLVIGPLISRIIGWLKQFLPEWELPSVELPVPPAIKWPTLPLLPSIELPRIPFPSVSFPSLPAFDIPDWVEFLIEYRRIWVPVMIGIVIGIMAIRNHKKSEKTKQQWRENPAALPREE